MQRPTTLSTTCSAAGRAGSGRTVTEDSSVLGCLAPPCRGSSRQLRRPLHLPPLLQPHGGISFLAFSSCAPIRNLAGLFKDCFVKDIIQKGIIQFSTDHSHQEFTKAAWPYQSSREGDSQECRFIKWNGTVCVAFLFCQCSPMITGIVIHGFPNKSANKKDE